MRPTKNRMFCRQSLRVKMFFETAKKADNFIAFNEAEIQQESGFAPNRSYYCVACGGWHVTSKKKNFWPPKLEEMQETTTEAPPNTQKMPPPHAPQAAELEELAQLVEGMSAEEMSIFLAQKIAELKQLIADEKAKTTSCDAAKLKDLNQLLILFYTFRKKMGLHKNAKNHYERHSEKEAQEWKEWFEQRGKNNDSTI